MKRITDIQELRNIQMGILDDVHRFCEEQGLRYSLSSGTLIGAVRHQGYIPWDDDIDIYMLRTDYERFLKTYHDPEGRYKILAPSQKGRAGGEAPYYYTFAKVVDQRTKMVEKETEGYEIGVYIDVFPVDYVPEDKRAQDFIFRAKKLLYKIRRCKISNSNPLHSQLAYWCYRSLPVTVGMLDKLIRKLIVHHEPTGRLCHMTEAGPATPKGCFPAADMKKMMDMRFEDRVYKVMIGYDDYLTRTYGDYMKLPPENQRTTHQFEAYWL